MVTEKEIVKAKAHELKLPFVDLDHITIDGSAVAAVPAELAERMNIMPICKDGPTLWLAISSFDQDIVETVSSHTGLTVRIALAVPSAVERARHEHYRD